MDIEILFLICLIDIVTSRKGFPSQVFDDEKFDCPSANKKVYTVKSQIQCTHRCLQNDACELINYNTERDVKENCEIFTQVNECSTKVWKKGWIAMQFQVRIITTFEYSFLHSYGNDTANILKIFFLTLLLKSY